MNINGFRVFSLALINTRSEYRKFGNDDIGLKGNFYIAKLDNKTFYEIFGGDKKNISKDINRGIKNIRNILIQNGSDPDTAKYYPIFSEIDMGNKEVIFNPFIFNPDMIDLKQIQNFSRIILPRLSDTYQKERKLSKNAVSLELLLQSHKNKYYVNVYRLKEQLGLIEYDEDKRKITKYKYLDFGGFNRNLKKWVKEINDIDDNKKIINHLTYKVIYDGNKYAKDILFTYEKRNLSNTEEMFIVNESTEERDENKFDLLLEEFIKEG